MISPIRISGYVRVRRHVSSERFFHFLPCAWSTSFSPSLVAVRDPRSTIRDPRSAIHDPRSTIRDPRSAIQFQIADLILQSDPPLPVSFPRLLSAPAFHPIRETLIHTSKYDQLSSQNPCPTFPQPSPAQDKWHTVPVCLCIPWCIAPTPSSCHGQFPRARMILC